MTMDRKSKSVEIEVEIDVRVYTVECDECKADLPFDIYADNDGDITVNVERCECRDEQLKQEGRDE